MDWEKAERGPQISLFSKYHFTSSEKWGNNSTNTRDVCEDGVQPRAWLAAIALNRACSC